MRARESAERVGSEACARCHGEVHPRLADSRHGVLMRDEERGCESCHGPASLHVRKAGDPDLILDPGSMKPRDADALCLDCHTSTASPASWGRHAHGESSVC